MIVRMLAAGVILTLSLSATAQERYVLDPAHSRPTFEAKHMGYSWQFGSFEKVTGKAVLDRAAKTGSLDVTIDTTSIKIFDPRLDATLKGEKFFNIEKFPTATFKSTSVTFDGDRVAAIDGELTMIGVTKPVSLKVTDFACGEHPFNKRPICGGNATATIKRSEWGMTTGIPLTPADEVRLRLPFEAFRE